MRLEKITEDILPYLKKLSVRFSYPEHLDFYHWDTSQKATEQEARACLQASEWLLLEFAAQGFYDESQFPLHTSILETANLFERQKQVLSLLFARVTACPILLPSAREPMCEVKVRGLSGDGHDILERFRQEEWFPPELCDLYGNRTIASDWEEQAFFRVLQGDETSGNPLGPSRQSGFWQKLWSNPLFRSLDLSGLTLHQCEGNALVREIVRRRDEVFLFTLDRSEDCGRALFTKLLFWV